jgi:hypothetical protein
VVLDVSNDSIFIAVFSFGWIVRCIGPFASRGKGR